MKLQDAIFVVSEENLCPLYKEGDEFSVDGIALSFSSGKPVCLVLAQNLISICDEAQKNVSLDRIALRSKKTSYECSGCSSFIRFHSKKEKPYTTLQMKLLAEAEKKTKILAVTQFADLLRSISIFSALGNDDLLDLAGLLELQKYDYGFPVVQKGMPGQYLYIILSGRVEVLDEDGVALNEMGPGDIFGEMSLLTGERACASIMTSEPCTVASMDQKNFRYILQRFPQLQLFFYKLMVQRITDSNEKRAGELAPGMAGDLVDVPSVDLCQMINSISKTGRLMLETDEHRKGCLKFNKGDIVEATIDSLTGKNALFEILSLKKGRFMYVEGLAKEDAGLESLGSFMMLMMEGLSFVDEKKQKR